MRFFELASALLCAVTVSATPTQLHNEALAQRDNAELEPRLLGDLLGWGGGKDECGDKWKINLCKLKGTGWFCNKDCNCEYKPPQQHCDPWVKKDCENKHNPRFVYNHEKCKCEDKGCPWGAKDKCLKEGGTYNDHECYCKPKPTCPDHVKKDCEAKKSPRYVFNAHECKCEDKGCPWGAKDKCVKEGGTYNDHECKCTPKPACPDHVKWDCEAKKSPRYVFEKEHCKCVDKGCPKWEKEKCVKDGGSYNDHECKCTPKPACPEHVKWDCEAKKSPRYVFEKEHCKCVDKGCPKWEKEKCVKDGGSYNDHECKCTPKPKPTCNKWEKEDCYKYNGRWEESHCKCYPKEEEKCKDWLRLIICKKLGKSCDGSCNCF